MGLKLQGLSLALRCIRSLGTRLGGSGVKGFRISGSSFVGLLRSVRLGFGIWVVSRARFGVFLHSHTWRFVGLSELISTLIGVASGSKYTYLIYNPILTKSHEPSCIVNIVTSFVTLYLLSPMNLQAS